MKSNNYFFLLLISTILLSGCYPEPEKPDDLIREPVYVDLLTEVFLTQSMASLQNLTEKEDSLLSVLFDRYEVTRDQFDRSHEYYQRQGEAQVARTDSIRDRLRSEREALMRARQEMSAND